MKFNEELDIFEVESDEYQRLQDYWTQKTKVQDLTQQINKLTQELHKERAVLTLLVPSHEGPQ